MPYLRHEMLETLFCEYWFSWILHKTNTRDLFTRIKPFSMTYYDTDTYNQHQSMAFICQHSYLSCDIIEKNIEYHWCWSQISNNPNITWDFIKKHIDKPWNWKNLSKHKCILWGIIRDNPQINWHWGGISENPNITLDNIMSIPNKSIWDWVALSKHPNISWKIIKDNPQVNWDFNTVSENPNITLKIIQENPNYHWNWCKLSKHPNMSLDAIKTTIYNLDKNPINLLSWCSNPNITENIISNILNSSNKKSINSISWDYLSYNKSISWEFIQKYRHLFNTPSSKTTLSNISYNPNITGDIVDANPDWTWYPELLSKNPMPKWKDEWIMNLKIKHIATLKIQRLLRYYNYNPVFKLARKNLQRQYDIVC